MFHSDNYVCICVCACVCTCACVCVYEFFVQQCKLDKIFQYNLTHILTTFLSCYCNKIVSVK